MTGKEARAGVSPQGDLSSPRGVFIHSDGKSALGIQLSGDISQLEAFALISITLERLRNDLKLD